LDNDKKDCLFLFILSNAWLRMALISSFSLFLIKNSSRVLIFLREREGFEELNITGTLEEEFEDRGWGGAGEEDGSDFFKLVIFKELSI